MTSGFVVGSWWQGLALAMLVLRADVAVAALVGIVPVAQGYVRLTSPGGGGWAIQESVDLSTWGASRYQLELDSSGGWWTDIPVDAGHPRYFRLLSRPSVPDEPRLATFEFSALEGGYRFVAVNIPAEESVVLEVSRQVIDPQTGLMVPTPFSSVSEVRGGNELFVPEEQVGGAGLVLRARTVNTQGASSAVPVVPYRPGPAGVPEMEAFASPSMVEIRYRNLPPGRSILIVRESSDDEKAWVEEAHDAEGELRDDAVIPGETIKLVAYVVLGDEVEQALDPVQVTIPKESPAAPGLLALSVTSEGNVRVEWGDLATTEDGFEIERAVAGADFRRIAVAESNPDGAARVVDSDVQAGIQYCYRVRAFRAGASPSGYSPSACIVAGLPSPQAPGPVQLSMTSAGNLRVEWADNSVTEDAFEIERSSSGLAFGRVAVVTSNGDGSARWVDDSIVEGLAYCYRVRATRARAVPSGYSPTECIVAGLRPPYAPGVVSATVTSAGNVRVEWVDMSSNETGFEVERSADGGEFRVIALVPPNDDGSARIVDTGTMRRHTYCYRVRAIRGSTRSDSSPAGCVTVP